MSDGSTRSLRRAVAMQLRGQVIAGLPLLLAVPAALAQEAAGGLEEVVVTAQKRTENLQSVPISIQAFSTERLDALQINAFEDYTKFMPSVSITTLGPGSGLAYFRGVASGENNNHSGPAPSVGMYLDEQPITTIQGSLDVHLYDIERVEALAGPQGTLFGASSQAGTIRIITNKPDPAAFDAGIGLEYNTVAHGDQGYLAEGFVNLPVDERTAIRLVGWSRHDAGYIDNVAGARTFPTSGGCISNTRNRPPGCDPAPIRTKNDFNDVDTYGGRAALRWEINDEWSITPQYMAQNQSSRGSFAYDPAVGDLKIVRYYPERWEDNWSQAALTIEGKIGNFDITYAGAWLDRQDEGNNDYSDYSYFYDVCCGYGSYWGDDTGTPLPNPSQYIEFTDEYDRQTHELRVTSPQDQRLRFVLGAFYQQQDHKIFQNYKIDGLGGFLDEDGNYVPIEVTGWPDTIWLTNQLRKDKETAVFGELYFDILDNLTATAGLRWFKTENSLKGFFGFNANYSSNYGEALCFSDAQFRGSPCTNLDDEVSSEDTVPKFNLTYRFDGDKLVYATYSEGFRPGGINRNGTVAPYKPDYLTNYELGWKSTWGGRFRLNGAIFREEWDDIQYSFLPPSGSGLTVIKNAGNATVDGIEMDVSWAATDALMVYGGLTWLDARLSKDYVPDPDEPPAAFKGDQLPIAPEFKANVTGRYSFRLADYDSNVQLAAVYNGSSWSDLPREERSYYGKQPAYMIYDLSAGFGKDGRTWTLFIHNVLDNISRTYTYSQCTVSVCGVNPYYVPNVPRTVGIKLTQEF